MPHRDGREPPLITDARPSAVEEQSRRRRTYSIIMGIHIVGFAASYPCYLWHPWAGAALIGVTGLLPWVGVILANDAPRRDQHRRDEHRNEQPYREHPLPGRLSRAPSADSGPPAPRPRWPS